MRVTSPQNPRIKALARLKERRHREREGRCLVEGPREAQRAVAAGVPVELAVVWPEGLVPEEQALLEALVARGVPVLEVAEGPMRRVSYRENPGGLVLVARPSLPRLEALRPPPHAPVLVAVNLEKPGNLGAILRSADAAGAGAVVAVGGVDLMNPNVIRSSTGVVFTLPTAAASSEAALDWVRARERRLVAATPHAEASYWEVDLTGAVAIAVGPEHAGLPPEWLEAADVRVRIPMCGRADSLNVSVSAALLLYEALRQKSKS